MDGTIEVESEVGKGSIFIVTIPFTVISKEEVQTINTDDSMIKVYLGIQQKYLSIMSNIEENEKNNICSAQSLSKPGIIIAEDNPINAKVLLNFIQSMGYDADGVKDGKELIDSFNIDHHKIVLTDMVSSRIVTTITQHTPWIHNRICQI